jgi:hypothetical protein
VTDITERAGASDRQQARLFAVRRPVYCPLQMLWDDLTDIRTEALARLGVGV